MITGIPQIISRSFRLSASQLRHLTLTIRLILRMQQPMPRKMLIPHLPNRPIAGINKTRDRTFSRPRICQDS